MRAFGDVWLWCIVLQLGFADRRWLVVPIWIPLLFRRRQGECDITRAYRQEACADHVIYADACTEHGHGMGFYAPEVGWNSLSMPLLTQHLDVDGQPRDVDINVLEYIAAMVALVAVLRAISLAHVGRDASQRLHVHFWTDNTASMPWMLTNRAVYPLHVFLVQVMALLKVSLGITATVGHIPGTLNVYADAASRAFQLPNGQGPAMRVAMNHLPRLPLPTGLMEDIVLIATKPSTTTSTQTLSALTALAGVRGWILQR